MHLWPLQSGAVAGQSSSWLHSTHRWPSSQIGVGAAQSALVTQTAHAPVLVLHFGVAPEHCASVEQAGGRHS